MTVDTNQVILTGENSVIRLSTNDSDIPLSTFSRKIDIGYMFQLYPFSILEMLNIVRDIRNDFAHCAEPIDFNLTSMKDRSENLEKMVFYSDKEFVEHSTALLDLIRPLNPTWIEAMEFYKWLTDETGGPVTIKPASLPRERFTNGVKFLLTYFARIEPVFSRLQMDLGLSSRDTRVQPEQKVADRPKGSGRRRRQRQPRSSPE